MNFRFLGGSAAVSGGGSDLGCAGLVNLRGDIHGSDED